MGIKIWWKHFKCWVSTGHKWDKTKTSTMMTNEMNMCVHCDRREAGPDGWR